MNPYTSTNPIYDAALHALHSDASPNDLAPDYLACAETVTTLVNKAVPGALRITTATYILRKELLESPYFQEVSDPIAGDIIISATGYGGKNGVTHGHCGIVLTNNIIASNSSRTGLFDENFTLASWYRYFRDVGGYEVRFFRFIS